MRNKPDERHTTRNATFRRLKKYLDSGDLKSISFYIDEYDINAELQRMYNKSSVYYEMVGMPRKQYAIINILRNNIKISYPEWCEFRTSPSRVFTTYWKSGDTYTILIKRRYARIDGLKKVEN